MLIDSLFKLCSIVSLFNSSNFRVRTIYALEQRKADKLVGE